MTCTAVNSMRSKRTVLDAAIDSVTIAAKTAEIITRLQGIYESASRDAISELKAANADSAVASTTPNAIAALSNKLEQVQTKYKHKSSHSVHALDMYYKARESGRGDLILVLTRMIHQMNDSKDVVEVEAEVEAETVVTDKLKRTWDGMFIEYCSMYTHIAQSFGIEQFQLTSDRVPLESRAAIRGLTTPWTYEPFGMVLRVRKIDRSRITLQLPFLFNGVPIFRIETL